MTHILTLSGSPSHPSRTAALLVFMRDYLQARGLTVDSLNVRDMNAEDLLHGRYDSDSVKAAVAQVKAARGLIIGTPVYKAAYTGVLKTFFDVLPAQALHAKIVLPIALGGSLAHSLVIDYALRPVLAALGTTQVLPALYLIDKQVTYADNGGVEFADPDSAAQVMGPLVAFYEQVRVD